MIAAYIGSNSKVNAGGNIDVEADGDKTFSSNVFSFAVAGLASLNGTVTVVGIGGGLDSTVHRISRTSRARSTTTIRSRVGCPG